MGKADGVFFYNNIMDWTPAGSDLGDSSVFGTSLTETENLVIKNNVFWWNGSTAVNLIDNPISNLMVTHNNIAGIQFGNVAGTYSNNITTTPGFNGTGILPDPYYRPSAGSNLIDSGTAAGLPPFPYTGTAPNIGVYE